MGQFQDTMYKEYPLVIRDVTAAQFAVQAVGAPSNPGIRYRVDNGSEYKWDGSKWVAMVSAKNDSVTGLGLILSAGKLIPVPQIIAVQNTPSSKTDSDTAEATLYQFIIPGGLMGPNDSLRITHLWTYPNSATTKNLKMYVGASPIMSFGVTTTQKHQGIELFRNRNSLLSQISANDQVPFGPRAAAILATTLDMSVDQLFKVTGAWGTGGTGTNSITLESIMIELLPSNA